MRRRASLLRRAAGRGVREGIHHDQFAPQRSPRGRHRRGRAHSGDENGNTTYYCARLLVDGYQVTVNAEPWSNAQKESSSSFTAPEDEVLIGRLHSGDENGSTYYQYATLVDD